MSEIVSLSKARKAKAKSADRATAAENRVKFGRTKAEKTNDARQAERAARLFEGKKRED